jgi:hypothetical protein
MVEFVAVHPLPVYRMGPVDRQQKVTVADGSGGLVKDFCELLHRDPFS